MAVHVGGRGPGHLARSSGSVALGVLTLSAASFTAGTVAGTTIGALQNTTPGSTLTVTGARTAISGTNLLIGLQRAAVGTFTVDVTETVGAVSLTTTLTITVTTPVTIPSVPSSFTSTIYVAAANATSLTPGNDSTGTGAIGAPYATLIKAQSVIAAAGGVHVLCDGTFTENSTGRFLLIGNFTAPVLYESYTGDPTKFIITNASGTSSVIAARTSTAKNIHFRYMTARSSTDSNNTVAISPTANGQVDTIQFFDCVIEVRTAGSRLHAVVFGGNDFTFSNINFVRCTFKATTGSSTTAPPDITQCTNQTQTTANQPITTLGFYSCTTDSSVQPFAQFSGQLCGVNGLTIYGNTFSTNNSYGILVGKDSAGGTSPKCTSVYVGSNTITASGANPHAILIGENTIGATVESNTVTSNLQGIVVKGSSTVTVCTNGVTVSAGALTGLYNKASTSVDFEANTCSVDGSSSVAAALKEGWDSVSSTKAGSTTAKYNTLTATGATGSLVYWGDTTESTGGATVDLNTYTASSGAKYGQVRATTAITTLANVRTAWGSVGLSGDSASNDANSQ